MNCILKAAVIGSLVSIVGCSSILTDKTQRINVQADKPDLKVEIDGQTQTVPGIITVKKENKDKTLQVISDDCKQSIALNKQVESTFFLNILSGGVFGSTTDYATEKMWHYQDSISIKCP